MFDFVALKKLSASDLTFFQSLFRTIDAGNQKSVNLNADVLTGKFYPTLSAVAATQPDGEISLPLTIQGPANASPYKLQRKIVKGDAYKNWRLNGEFVYDPSNEPGRFNILAPNDLAIFGFRGKLRPQAISLYLLASNATTDAAICNALAPSVATVRRSMVALDPAQLAQALEKAGAPSNHPLFAFAFDPVAEAALVTAALGDDVAANALRERKRIVSRSDLAKAKASADRNGAQGEALVNVWLSSIPGSEHTWASSVDALSPYDFRRRQGSERWFIDVKSTNGPFENDFHLSLAEARHAARSVDPYVIYRVFEMTDESAVLRISEDIRAIATRLTKGHDSAMFGGVRANSFTMPVAVLKWGDVIALSVQDDDE